MSLDEGDSFQLDLLAALFYPAAYLFTSIFSTVTWAQSYS